jgi:hypothetical protein
MKRFLISLFLTSIFHSANVFAMAQELPPTTSQNEETHLYWVKDSRGKLVQKAYRSDDPNCPHKSQRVDIYGARSQRQLSQAANDLESYAAANGNLEAIAMRQVCKNGRCRESTYDCGAFVRTALEKAGLTRRGQGSLDKTGRSPGYAKDFGTGLKQNGFKNLCGSGVRAGSATCDRSPASAPVGSVLIYDTTGCGHPAGHVEIKTSRGYVSDYFSTTARTGGGTVGRCRRLIGVWVK